MPRAAFAFVALALLALVIAGCGGGGSTTTSGEATAASGEATATSEAKAHTEVSSARAEEAKAAALKDAQPKVAAPTGKSIGFMYLSKSTEGSVHLLEGLEEVASLFNFKVTTCDPNFEPAKVAQCMTTLVAQNPSLIILSAQSPAVLGGDLKTASERHIPVIVEGALQAPSPYFTAQYVPNEKLITKALDKWLFGLVEERIGEEKGVVAAFQAPTVGPGVNERDEQRRADLKSYPNLSEQTHDIDLPNAIQDTLAQTKTFAQQNPDLQALWQTCEFCAPPMGQALTQLGLQGEKRPFTGAFYTTKQSREMIKTGELSGAVEINWPAMSWVAMDQALQYWARKTPFAKTNAVFQNGYGIEMLEPWIVTQENVGNPAVVNNEGEDYVTYFETKWNAEFGVGKAG
ncbi:MAG: substrate-binding domain-containing protein [Actinobacteria bacterium]|nr:substrate-binding domain-containing protein [Actinomycetota bacterium]